MQDQSFTLYAQWEPDRHSWMIVDDTDFHPLIRADSPDELMEAYRQRLQKEPESPDNG